YGGDRETRIQQEIILGIGGVRALKALGSDPGVFHLNEGHAGFVVLQRIRDLIEQGASFDSALDEIRQSTIFTTHTPVPAGHDAFPFHLVEKHLAGAWGTLGANRDRFLALGSYDNGSGTLFNMTALAIRSAGVTNAVSQLHGRVTRAMFAPMWPDVPEDDRPVTSVTNGVHVPTWIAADLSALFTTYLGPDWFERHDDPSLWDGASRSRTSSCGRRGRCCAATCSTSSANARASAGPKRASASRASWPPARRWSPTC